MILVSLLDCKITARNKANPFTVSNYPECNAGDWRLEAGAREDLLTRGEVGGKGKFIDPRLISIL